MNITTILSFSMTMLIIGSSSVRAEECKNVNWYKLGLEDGLAKREDYRMEQLQVKCMESGLNADFEAYEKGRNDGLKKSKK